MSAPTSDFGGGDDLYRCPECGLSCCGCAAGRYELYHCWKRRTGIVHPFLARRETQDCGARHSDEKRLEGNFCVAAGRDGASSAECGGVRGQSKEGERVMWGDADAFVAQGRNEWTQSSHGDSEAEEEERRSWLLWQHRLQHWLLLRQSELCRPQGRSVRSLLLTDYPSLFCGVPPPPENPLPPTWVELGSEGFFSLSSAKEGNGVTELLDNNAKTFWQSDGNVPHKISVQFNHIVHVGRIDLLLNLRVDESYTPQQVVIRIGDFSRELFAVKEEEYPGQEGDGERWWPIELNAEEALKLNNDGRLPLRPGTTAAEADELARRLREQRSLECFCLQIAILGNHQQGRDSHIRQVRIYGPPRRCSSASVGEWWRWLEARGPGFDEGMAVSASKLPSSGANDVVHPSLFSSPLPPIDLVSLSGSTAPSLLSPDTAFQKCRNTVGVEPELEGGNEEGRHFGDDDDNGIHVEPADGVLIWAEDDEEDDDRDGEGRVVQ